MRSLDKYSDCIFGRHLWFIADYDKQLTAVDGSRYMQMIATFRSPNLPSEHFECEATKALTGMTACLYSSFLTVNSHMLNLCTSWTVLIICRKAFTCADKNFVSQDVYIVLYSQSAPFLL